RLKRGLLCIVDEEIAIHAPELPNLRPREIPPLARHANRATDGLSVVWQSSPVQPRERQEHSIERERVVIQRDRLGEPFVGPQPFAAQFVPGRRHVSLTPLRRARRFFWGVPARAAASCAGTLARPRWRRGDGPRTSSRTGPAPHA